MGKLMQNQGDSAASYESSECAAALEQLTWSPFSLQSEVESFALLMPLPGGGDKLLRGMPRNSLCDRLLVGLDGRGAAEA